MRRAWNHPLETAVCHSKAKGVKQLIQSSEKIQDMLMGHRGEQRPQRTPRECTPTGCPKGVSAISEGGGLQSQPGWMNEDITLMSHSTHQQLLGYRHAQETLRW